MTQSQPSTVGHNVQLEAKSGVLKTVLDENIKRTKPRGKTRVNFWVSFRASPGRVSNNAKTR